MFFCRELGPVWPGRLQSIVATARSRGARETGRCSMAGQTEVEHHQIDSMLAQCARTMVPQNVGYVVSGKWNTFAKRAHCPLSE